MLSSEVRALIEEAVRQAKAIPSPSIEEVSEVVVASCMGGEPWAAQLSLALHHSGVRAVRMTCVEASIHVLPYSSGGERVVAFSSSSRDTHLAQLANAASALGVRVTAYGPPPHPAYEDMLRELGVEYNIVEVGSWSGIVALLLATILWAPRPWESRRIRLDRELSTLSDSVNWVEEEYKDFIAELARGLDCLCYAPSTEPAVRLLRRITKHNMLVAPLHDIEGFRGRRVAAVYSSAEEHAYRHQILSAKLRGVSVVDVRVNTDPLTASLYVVIAGLLAGSQVLRETGEG